MFADGYISVHCLQKKVTVTGMGVLDFLPNISGMVAIIFLMHSVKSVHSWTLSLYSFSFLKMY